MIYPRFTVFNNVNLYKNSHILPNMTQITPTNNYLFRFIGKEKYRNFLRQLTIITFKIYVNSIGKNL